MGISARRRRLLWSAGIAGLVLIGMFNLPARWVPGFDAGRGRGHLGTVLGEYALPDDAALGDESYDGRDDCGALEVVGMACPHTNTLDRLFESSWPAEQLCLDVQRGAGGLRRVPDLYQADPSGGGCEFRFDVDGSTWIYGVISSSGNGKTLLAITAGEDPRR